jgi:acyl-CoA thioesterase FadM
MVAFDNKMKKSISIPPTWREKITQFENLEGKDETP